MKITPKELEKFISDNNLVFGLVDSPIGQIHALVSGSINHSDPFQAYALECCLWAFNGA